nr:PREDICTED: structural maintenance of chromosomes protein 5 [Bemisia tabaci]
MLTSRIDSSNPKRGVIVRISCKNFITYGEVEVCPGEHLNIIIGPNGSGKSTLVGAIILGLGGKPKLIGRSDDLSSYIKMGHKEATITIELHNPDGKNDVIRRKITKDGKECKTSWMLNGEKVSQKRVEEVVRRCNIQVENLCQFLPQERVQDFAKMNMKELLESTQRSIEGGKLADQLDALKALRKEQTDLQKSLLSLTQNKESEVQRNLNLEGEVRNAEEREKLVKQLLTMKQKQAFLRLKQKNDLVTGLKNRLQDRKKANEDIKKTQKQYENAIEGLKKELRNQDAAVQSLTNDTRKQLNELRSFIHNSSNITDKIEDKKIELENKLKTESKREEATRNLNLTISRLMNDLPESDETMRSEYDVLQRQIQERKNRATELQEEEENHNCLLRNKDYEIRGVEQEIARESNAANLKMEIMKQQHPKLYQGVLWLRENKHLFQDEVFEPMYTQITVQDGYAKYVEGCVPNRDLLAFTCKKAADTSLLIRELKTKQKLHGINVVTAPNSCLEGSARELFRPKVPLNEIKKYGLQTYLLDVINGPDPILHYLAKNMNLHNVPVGTEQTDRMMDKIPDSIALFFSAENRYSTRTSRYGGKKITSSSVIGGAHLLKTNQNVSRLKDLQAQQQKLKADKDDLNKQKNQLLGQVNTLRAELNDLGEKKNNLKRQLDQARIARNQIEQSRRRLSELQRNKIDPDEAKRNFKEDVKKLIQDLVKVRKNIANVSKGVEHSATELRLQKMVLSSLKDLERSKKEELNDYRRSIQDALEEIRQLEESVAEEKENVKRLQREAIELCRGAAPNTPAFEPYAQAFGDLPDDLEELEASMYEKQARVEILSGANNDSLREYEKRKKTIKNLERDIAQVETRVNEVGASMSAKREVWYPAVTELVRTINTKFSQFFASFQCGGRVELYENEDNYDEYGIRVLVRFRDDSELQPLDAHTQSGGERAVSTAVYLLSLQELTDVPFRVVDEINQGMDSSNERRVFDLLVRTISSSNSAQYFLLTPKLLDNLTYSEETTVLNVHNGPYALDYQDWDLQSLIEAQTSRPQVKRQRRSPSFNDENADANRIR